MYIPEYWLESKNPVAVRAFGGDFNGEWNIINW